MEKLEAMVAHSFDFDCSIRVGGRRPFARDPSVDYENASDEEWEEEPDGEDLMVNRRVHKQELRYEDVCQLRRPL